MACFNKVIIMGNLTRDPDLRTTPNGTKVATLGVALSEVWKDKAGQSQERVCFVDVEVWNRGANGKLAELCAQYLAKGKPVLVEGKLEQHDWTSKTGEKRSKLRVRADTVKFLGVRPQTAQPGATSAAPAAPAAAPAPAAMPPPAFAAMPTAPEAAPAQPAGEPSGDDEALPF